MNYLPAVSWGVYGGANTEETHVYYDSWGLLSTAPQTSVPVFQDGVYMMIDLGGGLVYLKQVQTKYKLKGTSYEAA
jgi:hypothetical protein